MKTLKETFLLSLTAKPFDDQVVLWNEFCNFSDNGSMDDLIYEDVESLIEACGFDAVEAVRKVFNGNVEHLYQFAYLNGYENIQNATDIRHSPICLSYLADWLEESEHQEWLDFVEAIEEE